MKLLDLVCSSCAHRDEYLLTTEEVKAANPISSAGLFIECTNCKGMNTLSHPVGEVQLDASHGRHVSWSQWNI